MLYRHHITKNFILQQGTFYVKQRNLLLLQSIAKKQREGEKRIVKTLFCVAAKAANFDSFKTQKRVARKRAVLQSETRLVAAFFYTIAKIDFCEFPNRFIDKNEKNRYDKRIVLIRYSTDKRGKPVRKAVVYTRDEHKIPKSKIDSDALKIVEHLRGCGYDAYIVGGAVRDLIVGKTPKDFDIVTDATPSKIKKLFRNSRVIGKRFRLVHVFFGDKIFEVSTFRSICEGSVGNSFGTMDEDVQRRDFTLNALYYDPIKEHVIDYVNGVEDIRKRVLKPVIPLDRIFEDDPVRMLRAIKYSSTIGCKMPHSIKHKIRKSAHLIAGISASRLTEEMLKIINSGHSFEIISAALELDVYMYLQPSACALIDADKRFEQHYMEHLKMLDEFLQTNPDCRLGKRLSFFLYDFVINLTDWKKEVETKTATGELYTKTWSQCRHFVLPMNPQRTELEYAIKDILTQFGVSVRFQKKSKNRKTAKTAN